MWTLSALLQPKKPHEYGLLPLPQPHFLGRLRGGSCYLPPKRLLTVHKAHFEPYLI